MRRARKLPKRLYSVQLLVRRVRPHYKLAELLAESRADLDQRSNPTIQAWMAMPDVGREKVDGHSMEPRNFAEVLARIPKIGLDDDFKR